MDIKMTLVKVSGNLNDAVYDLLVDFSGEDTEFAGDFFQGIVSGKLWDSVKKYISKNAKNIRINAVKVALAGVIIASVPFAKMVPIEAANNDRFSMSYVYGGTISEQIEQVRSTNNGLDVVSPSYFDIIADGSLKVNTISATFINAMHDMNIKVVPFLSNHWDRTAGKLALSDVDKLSSQLAGCVEQYNLDGINVDIENVTDTDRANYTSLVRLLREKIPTHKEVSVAVAANPNNWQTGWHGSYDYTALGEYSDYLMIMAYDEHYEGGSAGPVASIKWVENSIKHAVSRTSKDKIVVGLPFFGRIWSENGDFKGYGLSLNVIENMIKDYNAIVTYDTESQSPKAVFTVKAGDKTYMVKGKPLPEGTYTVWYENEQSLSAKSDLAKKYNLKGIGSWALGQASVSIRENIKDWVSDDIAVTVNPPQTESGQNTVPPVVVPPKETKPKPNPIPKEPEEQSSSVTSPDIDTNFEDAQTQETQVIEETQTGQVPQNTGNTHSTEKENLPNIKNELTGYATANLNVRTAPNTNGSIVTTIAKGSGVTLVGGVTNGWYAVRLAGGREGFVSAQYITTAPPAKVTVSTPSHTTGYVTATVLNVRNKAGTNGKIISTINKGQQVILLGVEANGWYKIQLANGQIGYVSAQYISLTAAVNTAATVNASLLNIRKGAGTNHSVITTVRKGTSVTILSKSGSWYQIRLSDGTVGYVSGEYLTLQV